MSPVGGTSRHPQGIGAPPLGIWKCPACGGENTGRLELGCAACGSGKPGQRVETPAPPRQAPITNPSGIDEAFIAWIRPLRGKVAPEVEELLYQAFLAGVHHGAATTSGTEAPLTGTAESRTVVAALRLFIETMLPHIGEEVARGEYLGRGEIEALIARLERTQ